MRQGLNVRYRNAAELFARSAVSTLGDKVHAIILFGSVARKEGRRSSDTDVLVVGTDAGLEDRIFDTAYTIMEHSNFESFITVVYFTRKEFEALVLMGTSFISNLLEEGSILYDDGTFAEARQRISSSC